MFGIFPKDLEAPEQEPVTERFPCAHRKVYSTKSEGPYPWICSICGDKGEDKHLPICDSILFWDLMRNVPASAAIVKPTHCYYCGVVILSGAFSETPPKCGKCT